MRIAADVVTRDRPKVLCRKARPEPKGKWSGAGVGEVACRNHRDYRLALLALGQHRPLPTHAYDWCSRRDRTYACRHRRNRPGPSRPMRGRRRPRRGDPRLPHRRPQARARSVAASPLLHERQHREGAGEPPHGRRARGHGAPRVIESIRSDLEDECRRRLGRPDLRVTSIEPIPEGHSGFTYFVVVEDSNGPTRFVLRLPPLGARTTGPADVVRQGRIMAALHAAGLPVPAIPALTADPAVDGSTFVLMEAVTGVRIEQAEFEQPSLDIAGSAITVLKRLHTLPLDETGIGDEEAVGLEAEMMRWAWLMQ